MRRVPKPLAAVVLVALVQSVAWAVMLPAFQGQDEITHVAYAQRIFETGKPSWTAVEDIPERQPKFSREVALADLWSGSSALALNVAMRPFGEEIDERRWREIEAGLTDADREGRNATTAMRNPPLYYLYEAAVYAPLNEAPFFTRLTWMRLASVPFVLIAVIAAWLLAGEVFGRRRWLQAIVALTVALHPMLAQLGGIVNPDAMIAALWGVGLWLAAAIARRGVTRGRLIGAIGVAVAAGLTHPRAAPVVLPLAAAMAFALWPSARAPRWAGPAVAVAAALVVGAVGVWAAVLGDLAPAKVREFASYVWQFYLPRPDFMSPVVRSEWGSREVFVDRLWSGFAQLEVNLAPGILDALSWATMAGAVLTVVALVVHRDAVRRRLPVLGVLVIALAALLFTLHVAAWRDLPRFGDPVITGRYLTPLLPLAGLSIAAIALALPRRLGPAAATLVLGLEALLALSALGTAVVRFYV